MAVGGQKQQWSELLTAAQQGDATAYRRFLIEITPFLRALARQSVGAIDLVEDIVQETLLTVHRVRHTYDGRRPVQPWLAAILRRRAVDVLRTAKRQGRLETYDMEAYETFALPRANIEGPELALEHVAHMIAELPRRQRAALELTKVQGLSLAEASVVSGQSIAALKVNVHRAVKRLRSRFQGEVAQ